MVLVVAAGVVAAIIGAIGPWATAGVFSKSGFEGDGVITAIIAGILGLALISNARTPTRRLGLAAAIAGLVIAAIGVIDIVDINEKVADNAFASAVVSIGWGLYLTVAGGVITIVGGLGIRTARA